MLTGRGVNRHLAPTAEEFSNELPDYVKGFRPSSSATQVTTDVLKREVKNEVKNSQTAMTKKMLTEDRVAEMIKAHLEQHSK